MAAPHPEQTGMAPVVSIKSFFRKPAQTLRKIGCTSPLHPKRAAYRPRLRAKHRNSSSTSSGLETVWAISLRSSSP